MPKVDEKKSEKVAWTKPELRSIKIKATETGPAPSTGDTTTNLALGPSS